MPATDVLDVNMIEQAELVVDQRRREAAERLGVVEDKVQLHRLELRQLRETGLLIDLDVRGISMFTVRADYAELGIGAEDVRAERLRAGTKDLFPGYSKKLRSLEARARQNLDKHSHVVPAFGQYRWLPWTAYEAFQEQHQRILEELEAVKHEVLVRYDEIVEQNRTYFEQVALRAWRDLRAQFDGPNWVVVTKEGKEFLSTDRNGFVEYIVQRALGKMPLPDEIKAGVQIDYKTSILYSEAEIEAEESALEQALAQQAQARLQRAQAQQALFEIDLERRAAEQRAQARIEAYRRAEMEHARQQLAEMGSPIQEALDGLRSNLYDAVSALLSGLRKHGGFRGQASTKAAELYAYWRRLNGDLLQDDNLEQALADLDAEMKRYQGADKEFRDAQIGDIEAQLTEIMTLTAESARKLRREGTSRAAALEL